MHPAPSRLQPASLTRRDRHRAGGIPLAILLCLAGCTAPPPPAPPPRESMLEESARKVSDAITLLARTEASAEQAKHGVLPAEPAPAGDLAVPVSLDFTGPMSLVVRQVAALLHYDVIESGTPPTVPTTVTLHANAQPVQTALQSLAVQAGDQADLVITPSRRLIEIRYAAPDTLRRPS